MKKLFCAVLCFEVAVCSASADSIRNYNILFDDGQASGSWSMRDTIIDGNYAFTASPSLEMDIENPWLINNLAYIGNNVSEPIIRSVIQMMIWKNTHPDYTFTLYGINGDIDTTSYEEEILKELDEYAKSSSHANKTFRSDLEGNLDLSDDIDLSNYRSDYEYVTIGGNHIVISHIDTYDTKEIVFYNNDIKVSSFYLYADKASYKPFSIFVSLPFNQINFIINENEEVTYEVYDLLGNLLDTITINSANSTYIYEKGLDIKLVEQASEGYIKGEDIIIKENEDSIYTITVNRLKDEPIIEDNENGNIEPLIDDTLEEIVIDVPNTGIELDKPEEYIDEKNYIYKYLYNKCRNNDIIN